MRRSTNIRTPLLENSSSNASSGEPSASLARRAGATYDLFLSAVNTMGVVAAVENVLLGWPSITEEGTDIVEIANPFLCATTCLIGIQALYAEKKRQATYQITRDARQAEAKLRILLDRALSSIISGASTANFSLDGWIALTLAFEALRGNYDTSEEYNISETAFWLAYMLPTASLGAAHAYLDFTRHRFSEHHPESLLRKSFKHLIHVLAYGSVINASSMLVAETAFDFNEQEGSANKRFYMYLGSTLLAILIEAISESLRKCPDRLMNTLSAFTLLTAFFLPPHLESLGETLAISEEVFWPVLLTVAIASGFRYAPYQSSEEFEMLLENASQENEEEEAAHNQDEAPDTQADVENAAAQSQSSETPVSFSTLGLTLFDFPAELAPELKEMKENPNNKHRRSFSF